MKNSIVDIQSSIDTRNQPIHRVGIKNLQLPMQLATKGGLQHTLATLSLFVHLPAEQKGTHMSRFVVLSEEHLCKPMNYASLHELVQKMLSLLEAQSGEVNIETTLFLTKIAPVSGVRSLMNYQVHLHGEVEKGQYICTVKVVVPVTSLCPCSKAISDYGAHNQRSHVTLTLYSQTEIDLEEVIELVEKQSSCELYGILKRSDEKYVTEYAYNHPKFVEDIVRDIAVELKKMKQFDSFIVESENFESIHNHSAYAKIRYPE